MKSDDKLFEFHVENLRELEQATSRVDRALRSAIATGDEDTESAFTRLQVLLLAAWAEARLWKLLLERGAFSSPERTLITQADSQLDRWHSAVELGFRKRYGVPRLPLTDASLPHSAAARYATITSLLNERLDPVIALRNKLAHGQWRYPLNQACNDVVPEQFQALAAENLLSLRFKRAILAGLSQAIHDLVVSRMTFERDFDVHYRQITEAARNLATRKFTTYRSSMHEKTRRGRSKRRVAPGGPP